MIAAMYQSEIWLSYLQKHNTYERTLPHIFHSTHTADDRYDMEIGQYVLFVVRCCRLGLRNHAHIRMPSCEKDNNRTRHSKGRHQTQKQYSELCGTIWLITNNQKSIHHSTSTYCMQDTNSDFKLTTACQVLPLKAHTNTHTQCRVG